VSQRSIDNAVIKATRYQSHLEAMTSSVDELKKCAKRLQYLRDTSDDDRVVFNASKELRDLTMRVIELEAPNKPEELTIRIVNDN